MPPPRARDGPGAARPCPARRHTAAEEGSATWLAAVATVEAGGVEKTSAGLSKALYDSDAAPVGEVARPLETEMLGSPVGLSLSGRSSVGIGASESEMRAAERPIAVTADGRCESCNEYLIARCFTLTVSMLY